MSAIEASVVAERVQALDRFTVAEIARLDQQHHAQVHAVQLVREADHMTLDDLRGSITERFASVNEFRQALTELSATMATRREIETLVGNQQVRWEDFQKQLSELRSRIDRGPAELAQLAHQQALQQGRQIGLGLSANVAAVSLTILIAAIAMVATVFIATHK